MRIVDSHGKCDMKTDLYKGTYFIPSSRIQGIGIIFFAFVFEIEDVCNL